MEKNDHAAEKLKKMNFSAAAKRLQNGIEETLTYMDFPTQCWSRFRTNITIERLNQEVAAVGKTGNDDWITSFRIIYCGLSVNSDPNSRMYYHFHIAIQTSFISKRGAYIDRSTKRVNV